MRDHAYDRLNWRASEIEHRYGDRVHILADPFLLGQLAVLCARDTIQPAVNRLVALLYQDLIKTVINAEFPRRHLTLPTRMIEHTPRGIFQGQVIDADTRAVTVNIARAGTLPSQITFDLLNSVLQPRLVRQDHIIMNRRTDEQGAVIGVDVGGSKIGGDVDDAILMFPDPMGATGGSLAQALSIYRDQVSGTPRKQVAVNLIVTPEYLKRVLDADPNLVVYALRLDRGLSPPDVLDTVPGERWAEERGLNDQQYIVPGGGGFGEIMNNAFV